MALFLPCSAAQGRRALEQRLSATHTLCLPCQPWQHLSTADHFIGHPRERSGEGGGCYRHAEGRIQQLTFPTRWVHSDNSISETNYAKTRPLLPVCSRQNGRSKPCPAGTGCKVQQVTLHSRWLLSFSYDVNHHK